MLNIDWNNTRANFDPESLLQDFNTLFMLNAEKSSSLNLDAPTTDQNDGLTNLERYKNEIEFSPQAFQSSKRLSLVREESLDTMAKQMLKVTSDMRNSFMNFHTDINKFMLQYASALGNSEDTINYGSRPIL